MTKKEKKKEEPDYDYKKKLDEIELPASLKAGFQYYIKANTINIKSENDLMKELTKFKQLNAGA